MERNMGGVGGDVGKCVGVCICPVGICPVGICPVGICPGVFVLESSLKAFGFELCILRRPMPLSTFHNIRSVC